MIDRFALYRFMSPFRSRLQRRLREERAGIDVDAFARGVGCSERHAELSRLVWEALRERAFVPDFRPHPDDNLAKVYAMGPEEVWDEIIEPFLDRLGLAANEVDFTGLDLDDDATPRDVAKVLVSIAGRSGSPT